MMILMTFLKKLENFEYTNCTLVQQISNYQVFFAFLKLLCRLAKRGTVLYQPMGFPKIVR